MTNSQAPQPAPVPEPGWRLVLVNEAFDDLMYWLHRCDDKGHLENCADLIDPWSRFDYRAAPAIPAPEGAQADDRAAFRAYLNECDECAIVPDVAGAFNGGWKARAALAAPAPQAPITTVMGLAVYDTPAPQAPVALKESEKERIVRNWFADDWAIDNALGLLHDYDMALKRGIPAPQTKEPTNG